MTRFPPMRPPTACDLCRSRRRRCDRRDKDTGLCTLCKKHNVSCVFSKSLNLLTRTDTSLVSTYDFINEPSTRITHHPSSPVATQHATSASSLQTLSQTPVGDEAVISSNGRDDVRLPTRTACAQLATMYFDYVHDQFHTLFHRPTFMADLAMDSIPPTIMFAMIALAARFSTADMFAGTDPRTRGIAYARQSALLLDVNDVSLTSIQACVMLGACRVIEGDPKGEVIYYSIACRMAQLLNLPSSHYKSRLEREIHIRVWHTLCMIDEWSSSGSNIPRQIAHPPSDVPLPTDEIAFLQMRADDTSLEINTPNHGRAGLLAQMIALNRIFSSINQMNQRAVHNHNSSFDVDTVEDLSERLRIWELKLPKCMKDSPANLAYYAAQGLGRIYVAIYLGFYHYGQLLYYQFLHDPNKKYGTIVDSFADRCKYYAQRLCSIIYAALELPGCDTLYSMVGHVVVIASTVQIHTMLFSSDDVEVKAARHRLERNFEILQRLRALWPSLDMCMMRLQTFHKACQTSMDTPFKLDSWMLRFLSEFAKPIADKENYDDVDRTIGGIAINTSVDLGMGAS